ncbi:unnamed protein product [Acanthoscelides obtectus]|uniref:Uncharacterized protein n=1 Tax=Acanthoscelides obtectus TaxID=200917 RepID=A0A9P0MBU5_ACAOB|nr:unnamed protein product [Acanthoscelides obtectus]CAK1655904.1 hypothetical protein AOBTE_LOCUS19427 [Acanthoscelides obtectus]
MRLFMEVRDKRHSSGMRFLSSLILCLILQIICKSREARRLRLYIYLPFQSLVRGLLLKKGYSWMKRCITFLAHQMKSNMSILPQHYQHQKVIVLLKLLEYKNICLIRKKERGFCILPTQ